MNNDKTILARRKFYRGNKLTEEELLTIENADRREALVSKIAIKIVKSWMTYAIALISGIGAEITNLINVVD